LEIKIWKQKFRIKKSRILKIIHFRKEDLKERLLCSGNENLEIKMKNPFRIRKSIIQKICFGKRIHNTYSGKGSPKGIFVYTFLF